MLPFLSSLCVSAQINKNSVLLGGQLTYYNSKVQIERLHQKSESGVIGISMGKAVKENKVVGINFTFSPIRQNNYPVIGDTTNLRYNRFDIGGFYREYKKIAKDFYFFTEIDIAFITAKQTEHYKTAAADVEANQRGGVIWLTPGISYQVFKKWQLELTIPNLLTMQYLTTKIQSSLPQIKNEKLEQFLFYSSTTNNTGLGFLGVGFRFIL